MGAKRLVVWASTGAMALSGAGATASVARGASDDAAVSADGRYVAFTSSADDLVAGDTNHSVDVFVRDRGTGRTERVSIATGGEQARRSAHGSDQPAISSDGR